MAMIGAAVSAVGKGAYVAFRRNVTNVLHYGEHVRWPPAGSDGSPSWSPDPALPAPPSHTPWLRKKIWTKIVNLQGLRWRRGGQ